MKTKHILWVLILVPLYIAFFFYKTSGSEEKYEEFKDLSFSGNIIAIDKKPRHINLDVNGKSIIIVNNGYANVIRYVRVNDYIEKDTATFIIRITRIDNDTITKVFDIIK